MLKIQTRHITYNNKNINLKKNYRKLEQKETTFLIDLCRKVKNSEKDGKINEK